MKGVVLSHWSRLETERNEINWNTSTLHVAYVAFSKLCEGRGKKHECPQHLKTENFRTAKKRNIKLNKLESYKMKSQN